MEAFITTNTKKGIYSAYKGIVKKEDCDQMAHMNVQFYFGKHSDAIKNLFNKIKAGSKGGKMGQWSARKAQMLAKQYKAKGGGYK